METGSLTHVRLAQVIAVRAHEEGLVRGEQVPGSDRPLVRTDDVVAALARDPGVAPEKAESLAWGTGAQLTPLELDRISIRFAFHRDVLAAILNPASDDVMVPLLEAVREGLNFETCDKCDDLYDRCTLYVGGESEEQLTDLLFALLAHVRVIVGPVEADPIAQAFGDHDLGADELEEVADDSADDGEIDDIVRVFSMLPAAARERVLWFAWNEHREATSGRPLGDFGAYARLRTQYLNESARGVFDALAQTPQGELTQGELVAALQLKDARALGQLQRSVERAVKALNQDGYALADTPLEVIRPRNGVRIYRLAAGALSAWRSMMQAERITGAKLPSAGL